jgi:hypothetical protein
MQNDYSIKSQKSQGLSKLEKLQELGDIFEGSIVEVKPSISQERIKDFQSAYAYIMQTYKPNHSIKPCIAYVLVNGLADGWRVSAYMVAYECLRVFDWDIAKASELFKLYLENSQKKKTRTWRHLQGALNWVLRVKPKISCQKLSLNLPCIGDRQACNDIRGIRKTQGNKYESFELAKNQITLLRDRLFTEGYIDKISKRALSIYAYLLQKYQWSGFDRLFISYDELAKALKDSQKGSNNVLPYLKELQKLGLISFKRGSAKGVIVKANGKKSRIATEIKILDTTKRVKNRAEELFKEMFKQ